MDNGYHAVHLYFTKENDGAFDISPLAERKALEDAEIIIQDALRTNEPDKEERLVKRGEPPPEDVIVCRSKIEIHWDRKLKMATYKRGGHERFQWEAKWQPVAALMMEQYNYTMSILKSRERKEREERRKKKCGQ
jgi:hypothetical protein